MNKCHTLLWTNDYCRKLKRAGDAGRPLRVVFSGSHLSQPSLASFGVVPGDCIFVIRVDKGRLFLVGGLRIREYVTLDAYLRQVLGLPESYASLGLFELEDRLAKERPEWGHLLPWGCLQAVALGDGTPIAFDRIVPPDVVERMRFVSRQGERPIKHLADGLIKSTLGLQGGAYHLSDVSATELMKLLPEFSPPADGLLTKVDPAKASSGPP